MPIRGTLFKRFKLTKTQREKLEQKQRVKRSKRESKELKQLIRKRTAVEGEAALRAAISREKSRIKLAKKPSRIGIFAKALEKQAIKEIKKRKIGIEFNPSGKRRKKKRKKRS